MLHVIQKQVIDFRMRNTRADSSVLDEVSSLCRQVVSPVIEGVLDRYGVDGEYLLVDRLELDLGSINGSELHAQLEERVEQLLSAQLQQLTAAVLETDRRGESSSVTDEGTTIEYLSEEEEESVVLRSYLASGTLPWWFAGQGAQEIGTLLQRFIETRPDRLRKLLQALPAEKTARRIAVQFPLPLCWRLVGVLVNHGAAWGELLGRIFAVMKAQRWKTKTGETVMESLLLELLPWPGCGSDIIYQQVASAFAEDEASARQQQAGRIKALHSNLLAMAASISDGSIRHALFERRIIPSVDYPQELAAEHTQDVRLIPPEHSHSSEDKTRTEQEASTTHPAEHTNSVAERAIIDNSGQAYANDSIADTAVQVHVDKKAVGSSVERVAPTASPSYQHGKLGSAEAIYIHNAGLVLIWQYLPHFFQALGLLRDGHFIDDAARSRAVLAVQYLATFEGKFSEPEMALSKILCGLDVDDPVPLHFDAQEHEKREAESLLLSLIEHWSVLGGTTVSGLQDSFLQREGRLLRSDIGWQLLVERRAYDMLLDKLPWGIGLVRLKWMQGALSVEW